MSDMAGRFGSGDWLVTGSGPGEWTLLGPVGETMDVADDRFRHRHRSHPRKGPDATHRAQSGEGFGEDLLDRPVDSHVPQRRRVPRRGCQRRHRRRSRRHRRCLRRTCSIVSGPPANFSSTLCWTPEPSSESTSKDFRPVPRAAPREPGSRGPGSQDVWTSWAKTVLSYRNEGKDVAEPHPNLGTEWAGRPKERSHK